MGADILSGEQAEWEKNLTPMEREAIDLYTDDNFGGEMNSYVATGQTIELPEDEVSPYVDKLKSALSRNKIAENTETYRGVGKKVYNKLQNMKKGDTGINKTADLQTKS